MTFKPLRDDLDALPHVPVPSTADRVRQLEEQIRALLIVNAELLAAAVRVLQSADTFHDETLRYIEIARDEVEALRQVIAKAGGR